MERTAVVVLHGHHLCQFFRRLGYVASAQVVLALAVLPLIVLTPRVVPATVFLVLTLLIYAVIKGRGIPRANHMLKQLRLEQNFIRQIHRREHLHSLLSGGGRLWSGSRLWVGLQSILGNPLPDLLPVDERRRRLQRHYHRAIRDLQPPRYNLEALVLLLAVIFWDVLGEPAVASMSAYWVLAGFWALMLALEAFQSGLQWALGTSFRMAEEALAEWTLDNEIDRGVAPVDRPYVHHLLYHARPWFLTPRARTVSISV